MGVLSRLFGSGLPPGFPGRLERGENVVAVAAVEGGGHLVVTSLGLWIPADGGARRVGWHLVGKASWGDGEFVLTESEETGNFGDVVVLIDRAPVRYRLPAPGKVPHQVHLRVDGSVRSRHRQELGTGGAWFVQRKLPGRDGVVIQVRPDPGTDLALVEAIAGEVAAKLANPGE
ncbi:hypothetical protein [Amycolatopsis sp. FDAARGOS 1241]|uniref:hypothetical protein n=1 Tax=Amycolatopsis sp. FDAARGOS 1241 TaxID=2778070 RepID=UPI001951EAC2|nr:hypothetical protein [Amycolatopsis sp. FDAARGOS 1241]QRP48423.1 hypothetical protein I6J71_11520 [Amycolatopsis sp. FDAARGOS 1241]